MTKYKQIVDEMLQENKELFDSFEWVHTHYVENPKTWQRTFNIEGEKVLEVIRKYENILCRKTEGAGYSQFSSNLAQKYHEEIKKRFPKIDHVGIILEE